MLQLIAILIINLTLTVCIQCNPDSTPRRRKWDYRLNLVLMLVVLFAWPSLN
jgi:hypothetical protein